MLTTPTMRASLAQLMRHYAPRRLQQRLYYWWHDFRARYAPQRLTESHLRRYPTYFANHKGNQLAVDAQKISMLRQDLLLLLGYLVQNARGLVLEIGAYVGGATVVLARAAQEWGRPPVLAVELGGQHDNPTLPSADILRDLKDNLRRFEVSDLVQIVEGATWEPAVVAEVRARVQSAALPIGLLMIDADGNIERDLQSFGDLLHDGCILVIDDWKFEYGPEKAALVQDCVRRWEAAGRLEPLGIHGWCTWIGRYRRPRDV